MPEARHARVSSTPRSRSTCTGSTRPSFPDELALSAVTLAELTGGPLATSDPHERARRQDRLQRAEATFDPLPRAPDDIAHLADVEVVAVAPQL